MSVTMTEETHDAEMTPYVGHWRCSCGYVGTDDMMNRHMAEVGWCSECWGSGASSFGPRTGRCSECGGSGEAPTGSARYCRECRWGQPCYEHDAGYRAYCDEMTAIHEGLAMELTHCYLCFLEETGKADSSPKQDQGPLRGIAKRTNSGGPDPYEVLHLVPCGHGLI